MQMNRYILFPIIIIILFQAPSKADMVPKNKDLIQNADMLFSKKRYTDAFAIYNSLLIKHNIYTPQSILKMAFIKEAWGENVEALYYLNFFYEKYPEKKVFNKMKDIASKEKFDGYNYSDLEFFLNIYRNYHDEVILVIMGLIFIYFMAVATNKLFIKAISNSSPLFFILFLVIIFYLINFAENYINPEKAIVMKDKAILMNDASAGAKVIGTLNRGRRITILEEKDIWAMTNLNDKNVYVRKCNLKIN